MNIQKINELISELGNQQKKAMINLQKSNFQKAMLQFNLLARTSDELSYQCKLIKEEKEQNDTDANKSINEDVVEEINITRKRET